LKFSDLFLAAVLGQTASAREKYSLFQAEQIPFELSPARAEVYRMLKTGMGQEMLLAFINLDVEERRIPAQSRAYLYSKYDLMHLSYLRYQAVVPTSCENGHNYPLNQISIVIDGARGFRLSSCTSGNCLDTNSRTYRLPTDEEIIRAVSGYSFPSSFIADFECWASENPKYGIVDIVL